MYTNALRCIESDYPQLLGLAQLIGAITVVDGQVVPAFGVEWDYIGYKYLEDESVLQDAQGNKYIHVNARTPFSVGAAAAEAAAQAPEIAAALGNPARFFITDGNGNAVDPQYPVRVFA